MLFEQRMSTVVVLAGINLLTENIYFCHPSKYDHQ